MIAKNHAENQAEIQSNRQMDGTTDGHTYRHIRLTGERRGSLEPSVGISTDKKLQNALGQPDIRSDRQTYYTTNQSI